MKKDYSNIPQVKIIKNNTNEPIKVNLRNIGTSISMTLDSKDEIDIKCTTSDDLAYVTSQCFNLNLSLENSVSSIKYITRFDWGKGIYYYKLNNEGEELTFTYNNSESILNTTDWNTSLLTNMCSMFSWLSNLTYLNLSNFDTSNVTNMAGMFAFDSKLDVTNLDFSNFDVSKVKDFTRIFREAGNESSERTIDISTWNISNTAKVYDMFPNYQNACTIYVANENIKNYLENHSAKGGSSNTIIKVK